MEKKLEKNKLITWILVTGLLTGTLDILLAFLIYYKTPAAVILKFIASGVFGDAAFRGGAGMIYYGVLFHYCIALCWTTIFFLFYPEFRNLIKMRTVLILVTGLAIWAVMNLIAVPLSRIPAQHFRLLSVAEEMAALIIAYGLPFTLVADTFYKTIL